MKIVSTLVSMVVLFVVVVVLCYVFCNVTYNTRGYDILIYNKQDPPKHFLGIRYKNDFMIHYFKEKTLGDTLDSMLTTWQKGS